MVDELTLFDLDGTLTDSAPGIIGSLSFALDSMGLLVPSESELFGILGPPFRASLPTIGVPPDRIDEAISRYREHFNEHGIFDGNSVFPGIVEALGDLQRRGIRMVVATSKPQPAARRIVEHFDLARYFDRGVESVFGADPAGLARPDKASVIEVALATAAPAQRYIMVGDREHDVWGAREHGIETIGVSWGYAGPGELASAGAKVIVQRPQEIARYL